MKSFVEQSPIIVGGGIAGLSTALALAHKGIASTIIEKCKQLETIGAGIQLTRMQHLFLLTGTFLTNSLKSQ